ncbi:alanine racemase [Demequina globuliformis]|uniref:alanine racemase n=1 Tax=Demequina globuliformis TaxID=676202 RepID=UPI0007805968|nr:alanine racemase [Demequina globuliformis]
MFLDLTRRRNPALIADAVALHRSGAIPPNTSVIDLDAVRRNAAAFVAVARAHGLVPFAMTKQIGRNPDVSGALVAEGITHAVGVDLECAIAARAGGLKTGHLGHLVQIPRHSAGTAASLEPLFWTVFSEAKAREAAAAARARGREQPVLLRIAGTGDRFYRGHEGGFDADAIVETAAAIDAIEGLRFAGVTSFPATLFDAHTGTAKSTPNLATLARAKEALLAAGWDHVELNAPGTTSASVLPTLAAAGATQVEPGHGLTGTTPLHAVQDLVEEPAIVYVSEVSHLHQGEAFVFGGGLYVDPVLGDTPTAALVVGDGIDPAEVNPTPVDMPAANAIDYYATVNANDCAAAPGDTVVFGFRPQVFVTRGLTAAVSGIGTGSPRVHGIWSADGSAPITVELALANGRSHA